jgi:hypothetical protein
VELLLEYDIDKQKEETTSTNTLKAAIRDNSVPISEGSDPPECAEPYIIGSDQPQLHPYVSCVLFFEEYNEVDYEEQIEQLHHAFQQANIPEGLIATSIPSISSTHSETDKSDEMIFQCIKNDVNRVPVLALWFKEGLPTAETEAAAREKAKQLDPEGKLIVNWIQRDLLGTSEWEQFEKRMISWEDFVIDSLRRVPKVLPRNVLMNVLDEKNDCDHTISECVLCETPQRYVDISSSIAVEYVDSDH